MYLTPAGKASLDAELDELVNVQRPALAAMILAAREDGDLSENGAYHDAKDKQGLMEGRIRELKAKLERAQLIDPVSSGEVVMLGSAVTVSSEFSSEERYTIVGSLEANAGAGRISNESPLGRVLLGRSAGDEAVVATPKGEARYRILSIN